MKKLGIPIFFILLSFFFSSCDNPLFIDAAELYQVSFETNGGTSIDSYRTNEIEKSPKTSKDGYTFIAWYKDSKLTEKVDSFPLKIKSDIKLYAKWKQNFLVTFVTNGGTSITEMNTLMTAYLYTSPITERKGYEVTGWYTNAGFTGEPVTFPYDVSAPVTFYAKWEPVFTVTFVTNGGTALAAKKTTAIKVAPVSARDGYTLVAWYADEELTETVSFPFELTQNMALYARWEKNYTINFESNGGSSFPSQTTWCIEKGSEPIKNGYSFGGWYTNGDFAPTTKVSFPFYLNSNVTLYAKWNHYDYAVTYVLDGGYNHSENPDGYDKENAAIPLHEPTRNGCDFLGWYENADFSGSAVTEVPADSAEDKVYYAKWRLLTYSITYVPNGGSLETSYQTSYTIDTETFALKVPAKNGYNFGGWYETSDFAGKAVTEIEKGSFGTKIFFAKWTTTAYAISYELNGGILQEPNPENYDMETETFVLNAPARMGYSFGGWYERADFSGNAVIEILKGSYGDKVLYAKWNVITYSITYVLNGGTNSTNNPASYTIETETITLTPPVFDDEHLGTWYENDGFSRNAVSLIAKGSYGDKTLYARKESNNAELARLSFYGNEITVYDNADDRNEIASNVNIHEYYIEYQSVGTSANVEASFSIIAIPKESTASISLSNKNPNLKIKALDSTQQDVTLTVTAEDGESTNTYLIHAVRVFSYSDACEALTGRNCAMLVKIIDTPSNIKLKRVYSDIYEDPNTHLFRRDLSDTLLSKALDSESFYVVVDISDVALANIGSYAFSGCRSLKNVLLPVALDTVDEYAFWASGITEITIPESVTSINNNAFESCHSLSDVKLSNSITYIGAHAFESCVFSSIRLPNALTTIATRAFSYCANLTHIEIPASVSTIGYDAFRECSNLTSIVFEDSESIWFYTGHALGSSNAGTRVGCMNSGGTNADLLVKKYYNFNWYNSNYRNY